MLVLIGYSIKVIFVSTENIHCDVICISTTLEHLKYSSKWRIFFIVELFCMNLIESILVVNFLLHHKHIIVVNMQCLYL